MRIASMQGLTCEDISERIVQRAFGEFLEMPGLRLTRAQAQRLWGLDEPTCGRLLEFLVNAGFLWRTADGMYARLTDGPAPCPRARGERHVAVGVA
jgi:hypothetical protein